MEKLLISEEDLLLVSDYRIHYEKTNGYYRLYKKGKWIYLHRFLLNAKPGEIVDHIDRNKHNHLRSNLRIVSKSLNCYNKTVINKNGRGIYYDKSGNRWRACISFKNKNLKLGSFKDIILAKKAYNLKALEIYGKDAELHII